MVEELLDEVTGLGPLEPLLADPTISDIMVNGYDTLYIERFGKLELTHVRFRDNAHLLQIIKRIVSRVGRRIDESSPMVDARLPDGARVNAIIPPLALDGPVLSIRRFGGSPLRVKDLVAINSATPEMLAFLARVREGAAQLPGIAAAPAPARRPCSTRCRRSSPTTSASSPSRTRPSCSCSSGTSCAWRRARRTSRARARSPRATWSRTPCACGPTASSSASAAAARCSTCCRR